MLIFYFDVTNLPFPTWLTGSRLFAFLPTRGDSYGYVAISQIDPAKLAFNHLLHKIPQFWTHPQFTVTALEPLFHHIQNPPVSDLVDRIKTFRLLTLKGR